MTKGYAEQIQAVAEGEDIRLQRSLSHHHFCRAFRHSVGSSPHSYMQFRRIEQAKELLNESADSIGDVASTCGFADQSHFTRGFHPDRRLNSWRVAA